MYKQGASRGLPVLPEPGDWDLFFQAYHQQWVSGDGKAAIASFLQLADDTTRNRYVRALAALRMAELIELSGQRRQALSYLDQVKILAGPGHALALEADDRRARILIVTPLADVRGPVPGSVVLKGESLPTTAAFRVAERRMVLFHRIIVAPRMENMHEVLLTKRRSLAAAVTSYQQVIKVGGPLARSASMFRIASMYQHMAEALVFESPPELLPAEARRLSRKLRAESTNYLRRALGSYRSVVEIPRTPTTEQWLKLAQREAEMLAWVLKTPAAKNATQ